MKRLAILGASGHGKVVADAAELSGWDEVVFFDDDRHECQSDFLWPIIGNTDDLLTSMNDFTGVIVAIGNNSIRLEKLNLFRKQNVLLPVIVHPQAVVSSYTQIGGGCVICAGVVVNAGVSVGFGSILNTGCSIDHDCLLGEAVHISPGARLAGGIRVETCAWIGIGAVVRQLITVGAHSLIGAGAVVVRHVPKNVTVIGNPARQIKQT